MGVNCSVGISLDVGPVKLGVSAKGDIPIRIPLPLGFWGDTKQLWKTNVDKVGQVSFLPKPGAEDDTPPLGLLHFVNGTLEMCDLKGKSLKCPVDISGLNSAQCMNVNTTGTSIALAGGAAGAGYWWCIYRIDEDDNWAKNEQHALKKQPRFIRFFKGAGGITVLVDHGENSLSLYDREGSLLWSHTNGKTVLSTGYQYSVSTESVVCLDTAKHCLRLLDINGTPQKMIPDDPSPAILCKPTAACYSKCGALFVGHKNKGEPAVGTVPLCETTVKPVPIKGLSGEITGMALRDHKLAIACWDAEAEQGYLYMYYVV